MIVEKIKVGKSIETYGLWSRLDLECTISPEEDPQLAYNQAKALMDKLLPGVDRQSEPIEEKPQASKEQSLIEVISLCNTVVALERFRPQVEKTGNHNVISTFDSKMEQLKLKA